MFDLINGIPLHPLVVHAVVVLLPLAALGTIAIAVRPRWRRPYGVLVVAAAALSVVLTPVATSSGEALEERVGSPGSHAQMGDQLIWFELPLLVLAAALVYLDRRAARAGRAGRAAESGPEGPRSAPPSSRPASPTALKTIAALAVVAALATSVQVYRVGDSGARAAWGPQVSSSSSSSGSDDSGD